ncbi:hypothetical protein ACWGCW_15880 [Streptomyces sp. NPDC054933]
MSSPHERNPRFIAAFHQPLSGWTVAAEPTVREPADHAVAAMIQTVRARGQAPHVEVWGSSDDGRAWRHLETIRARSASSAPRVTHWLSAANR